VTCRWFRVPLEQIAYVRAIVEGYDGVAVVFSPDPKRGEIALHIAPGQESEAQRIVTLLTQEAGLIEIPPPADQPLRG
jgi:hypothetical protein